MKFNVLTIFPEMFPGPLGQSLAGKALKAKHWELKVFDIRKFAEDKHSTVDDKPFGGGTGMVMKPDVLGKAVEAIKKKDKKTKLLYPSPRGALFTQAKAIELSKEKSITFLCGRYEGVDHRVLEEYDIEEISIGDYVLSGGEIAALTIIDACLRLVPGVIIKPSALAEESFGSEGNYAFLLEYPHYTRPVEWKGKKVPDTLLSGHHAEIEKWRLKQAKKITKERRKDLWKQHKKAK